MPTNLEHADQSGYCLCLHERDTVYRSRAIKRLTTLVCRRGSAPHRWPIPRYPSLWAHLRTSARRSMPWHTGGHWSADHSQSSDRCRDLQVARAQPDCPPGAQPT